MTLDRNAERQEVPVDPETGKNVVTAFFRPETHKDFGIGGPAGADIYFDLLPGYAASDRPAPEIVTRKRAPVGEHGFMPTRDDMLADFRRAITFISLSRLAGTILAQALLLPAAALIAYVAVYV